MDRDPFGAAVDALVAAIRDEGEASTDTLRSVMRALEVSVIRQGLPPRDAADVAAEAVTRLVVLAQEGRIDERGGAGLVTEIARRLAIDVQRREGRTVPTDAPPAAQGTDDDELARLLDAGADADAIAIGMRRAFVAGQLKLVRIIRVWLDLAEELGRPPTSREGADACGVSHMTVQRALERFRAFVPRREPPS